MLARESSIQECSSITDLKKFVKNGSYVFTDLDNTLEETKRNLGSDQWFGKLCEYACYIIPDTKEAIACVLAIYYAVQHHVKLRIIEKESVEIIRDLQDQGYNVIGITARGMPIKEDTINQLKEIGFDFKNKIIFCDGKDKGLCMQSYLKNEGDMPSEIVAIDDKEKNLIQMSNAATKMGIAFTGLRYNYLDEKIKQVDFDDAQEELDQIKSQFSNEARLAMDKLKLNDSLMINSFFKPKFQEISVNQNSNLEHLSFNK